jgi:hypothetical protein
MSYKCTLNIRTIKLNIKFSFVKANDEKEITNTPSYLWF